MKKCISVILSFLLTLGLFVPFVSADSFNDLSTNHRFFKEVDYLATKAIISGYTDGRFGPDEKVTRAAAAAMIGRALKLDGQQRKTPFKDVNSTNFASGYIAAAVEKKIISGYPDGTFRPNATLTRGQMAILIDRAFQLKEMSTIRFHDVPSSSSAYQSIYKIVAAGITSGYPDGTFKPNTTMTRAPFSAFLARALNDRFKVSPPVIPNPPAISWNGDWKRADFINPGILEIRKASQSSFEFLINVASGGHAGEIQGRAQISGKQAYYSDPDFGCKLTFIHKGESIQVSQSAACESYGGIGTFFNGDFALNPKEIKPTLYQNGVFSSEVQDKKFQQLTGSDYQIFVDNMQMIAADSYDTEVNGVIKAGGVRGLYTFMEAIIIIGNDGHYYGAAIKDADTVHYYTTNPNYKNKLPKSIVSWKSRFNSYPVKYFYRSL
ncbi:S-layer homology domain-containing protein [Bacillus sp. B190/17]|uniref:S-layer homology domain-containing protein n=1 Tax=Bacillus lumedeiriae TaxID=3058829 RepID=A0ABW8ICQ1_9BACI